MKTKSFNQVLEESSPAVKRDYRKEVKKLAVKKVTKKQTKNQKPLYQCSSIHIGGDFPCNNCVEIPNRFADKDFDFNKFPSQKNLNTAFEKALKDIGEVPLTATAIYKTSLLDFKPTALPYEIEGEPAINCDKWTAMAVVIILLGIVTYAMHGDYQALINGLIN